MRKRIHLVKRGGDEITDADLRWAARELHRAHRISLAAVGYNQRTSHDKAKRILGLMLPIATPFEVYDLARDHCSRRKWRRVTLSMGRARKRAR